MKKYFLLILFSGLLTLSACSSDDDGDTNQVDPIVGTWVFEGTTAPGVDPDACPESSTISFYEDNSAESSFYLASNECEESSNEGSWENLGNNTYELEIPVLGSQQGTVNFQNSNNRFVFTTSGFTFTFDRQQ